MSADGAKKNGEMSFFDHLDDLRGSLIRALLGLLVGVIICYFFAPRLQDLLLIPFKQQTTASLALLAPTEGFIVKLKISLVAGVFLSAPWVFYQIWRFVAPALFENERKLVFPVVLSSTFLFLLGATFAAYVLPMATSFFLGFSSHEIVNAWSLGKYVDFVLRLLLAFGIVFELPLVVYFLARFGVVTPPFLRTYRKHMIVVFLVLASIITPPDVFTQLILTAPMVVLYEVSIGLAVIAQKRWKAANPLAVSVATDESDSKGEG